MKAEFEHNLKGESKINKAIISTKINRKAILSVSEVELFCSLMKLNYCHFIS